MPKWQFSFCYQPGMPSHWTWCQLADDGAVLGKGESTFSSIDECMEDAKEHGYIPPEEPFVSEGRPRRDR